MDYTRNLKKYIGKKTDLISDPLDGSTPVLLKKSYFRFGETFAVFQAVNRKRRTFEIRIGSGDIDVLLPSFHK